MTFQIATQSTDLDRYDNIRAAVDAATAEREHDRALEGMDAATLAACAQFGQNGDEASKLELIARSEFYIRSVVSEFRVSNGATDADLHQAALLGFLTALAEFDPDGPAELFTFAYARIRRELTDANRTASPVPIASSQHKRFFAALRAADNDPAVARRWSALQRLSITELEAVADAEGDDAALAREIVDRRVDTYDSHVQRGYVGVGRGKGDKSPVPEWDDYRNTTGRGLTGTEFDTVLAAVMYESLDTPRGDTSGDDDASACDVAGNPITADADAADPFEDIDNRLALAQMVGTLDDREREILTRHLDGETDREVATALGLSRPRVVNIRAALVGRLRKLATG